MGLVDLVGRSSSPAVGVVALERLTSSSVVGGVVALMRRIPMTTVVVVAQMLGPPARALWVVARSRGRWRAVVDVGALVVWGRRPVVRRLPEGRRPPSRPRPLPRLRREPVARLGNRAFAPRMLAGRVGRVIHPVPA
jgi:hypothetical protein